VLRTLGELLAGAEVAALRSTPRRTPFAGVIAILLRPQNFGTGKALSRAGQRRRHAGPKNSASNPKMLTPTLTYINCHAKLQKA
jgi:hypothetical protein